LLFAVGFFSFPTWPHQWDTLWYFVNSQSRVLMNFGTYYYHYEPRTMLTELRIDNFYCPHYPGRKLFCRVIFAFDKNTYIYAPENKICCLLFPNLTATSPNWLRNASFLGIKTYNNVRANAWLNNPNTDIYYETIATSELSTIPLALADSDSAIEWNRPFNLRPQSPQLFKMPTDGSCQKKCSFVDETDPFIQHARNAMM